MKKESGKYLIFKYVASSYVKSFLISLGVFSLAIGILVLTGLYYPIESALDLKYNSPFVFGPIVGFVILALICFFVGFLLYYYKYKRSIKRSAFHAAFTRMLEKQ